MEIQLFNIILFAAWFLSGIYLLDKTNSNPRKWGCSEQDNTRSRNEWLIIFFAPVVLLWFYGKRLFQGKILNFYNSTRRKFKFSNISIEDSHGNPLYGSDCDNPAIDELKSIINEAAIKRASDIFLDPVGDGQMSLRFRVDGSLLQIKTFDMVFGDNVINAIKVAAGMDITEKRRPQDGSFSARHPGENIAFRVATVGAFGGEKMAIRLLGSQAGPKSLEEIGFNAQQCELLKQSIGLSSGMILMCGGTGSGKTTTLYTLIDNIDYSLKNVISIEDPIERVIPNVSQMEVNSKADITFAKILRNALRQNPDVICLGEIRDEETAAIAVNAAQTGHLIISTVHSNDTLDTLDRLSSLGVPLHSLASTIKIIINQRLARKLCDHCKQPAAKITKKWYNYLCSKGLDYTNLYTAKGCPECNGTGYKGRIACFDILVIDNHLRAALEMDNASLAKLKQDIGSGNLRLHGATIAAQGITSLEEVDRITLELDGGL